MMNTSILRTQDIIAKLNFYSTKPQNISSIESAHGRGAIILSDAMPQTRSAKFPLAPETRILGITAASASQPVTS